MTTKNKDETSISSEDRKLFRNTVKNLIPLKKNKKQVFKKKPIAKARFTQRDQCDVLIESLDCDIEDQEKSTSDVLKFHRKGMDYKVFKKLEKGQISIQSELDLHGLNLNQANDALRSFINNSILNNFRCVRIIHGKGLGSGERGPVIKDEVKRLLKKWKQVLAFVSARQHDGGTGALYVLLKKE
jgi:DNA-nicking Smr family endonuclease